MMHDAKIAGSAKLPRLAALFAAADVSSSDGQHFPTGGRGKQLERSTLIYQRTGSTLFYTRCWPAARRTTRSRSPPSGEAAYVIDRLLYH